jgi:hypothetical protein
MPLRGGADVFGWNAEKIEIFGLHAASFLLFRTTMIALAGGCLTTRLLVHVTILSQNRP